MKKAEAVLVGDGAVRGHAFCRRREQGGNLVGAYLDWGVFRDFLE